MGIPVSEASRIGIAIRGGATKQGYFDYKAEYYKDEGWIRADGEKFWDEMVAWYAKNALADNQNYAPISDMD
jgi:hypothetical protein